MKISLICFYLFSHDKLTPRYLVPRGEYVVVYGYVFMCFCHSGKKGFRKLNEMKMFSRLSYFPLWATSQTAAIILLMTKSTGTNSALLSGSAGMVLRAPMAAPATTPVTPYMLSIHPGTGSLALTVTVGEKWLEECLGRTFVQLTDCWTYHDDWQT